MADHGPGQLTSRQLDLYAGQLARCLKALGTDAPIRADVQRELATVRAEQESRASPGLIRTSAPADRVPRVPRTGGVPPRPARRAARPLPEG
jgi:hypothetical protein